MIICVKNIIPGTIWVKLDMHFNHSTTHEIQMYFHSCMANSKSKFKLLCVKLSSRLKYIKVQMVYVCLFVFMVLFCSSFGSRSERPRALQLLIKMLIRWCRMWEGLVLLYRNFLFKQWNNQGSEIHCKLHCILGSLFHPLGCTSVHDSKKKLY